MDAAGRWTVALTFALGCAGVAVSAWSDLRGLAVGLFIAAGLFSLAAAFLAGHTVGVRSERGQSVEVKRSPVAESPFKAGHEREDPAGPFTIWVTGDGLVELACEVEAPDGLRVWAHHYSDVDFSVNREGFRGPSKEAQYPHDFLRAGEPRPSVPRGQYRVRWWDKRGEGKVVAEDLFKV